MLLGVLISTYLLKVVPDKEKELNTRGFRILGRIESNFFDKKLGFLNTVDYCISKNTKLNLIEDLTLHDYLNYEDWETNKKPQTSLKYDNREDKWNILFYSDYYSKDTIKDAKGKNIKIDGKEIIYNSYTEYVPVYQYDFERFIKPLIDYRKDFFEDYIIFYKDSILYQSSEFAFQNNTKDTLFNHECIKSGKVLDVTLSGKEYKAFYQPFDISSDSYITICGLISKKNYNRTKFLLDNYQMMLVLVCFLLLILAFPFLKMFTITRYERMMKTDIGIMLICLLGISAILTVLFLPKAMSTKNETWSHAYIKELNDSIQNNLKNEIDENYAELNRLEKLISQADSNSTFYSWYWNNYFKPYSIHNSTKVKDGVFKNPFKADSSFYELFSTNHIKTDSNKINNAQKDSAYLENVLFINSIGLLNAKWGAKDEGTPKVLIESRQYFKEIISKLPTKWKLLDTKNKYSFEPIYSYTSQENTLVITKRPADSLTLKFQNFIQKKVNSKLVSDLGSSINQLSSPDYFPMDEIRNNQYIFSVLGIETRLFSVMSPVMSNEYGFCIIDKKGEVLFHSDKERNLRENFLEECAETEQLKSAIYNNVAAELNLTFYGKKYHAYINKLDNEYPLYIITFIDSTYHANSLADMSNFGLIFLFSLIVLLFLLGTLCYMFVIRTKYLAKQNFDFRFLTFSTYNYALSKTLAGFLLINLFFLIAIGSFLQGFGLFFFIPLMILNIPIIGAYIMYDSTRKITDKYPFKENIYRRYSTVLQITAITGTLILLFFGLAVYYKIADPLNIIVILFFLLMYIFVFYNTDSNTGVTKIGGLFSRYIYTICETVFRTLQRVIPFYRKTGAANQNLYGLHIQKQIIIYPFVLILFLCTTSIIPGYLIFNQLSDLESTLTQNRRSSEINEHANERINYFSKIQHNSPLLKGNITDSKLYKQGIYIIPDTLTRHESLHNNAFYELYIKTINFARSNYNDDEIKKIFSLHLNNKEEKKESGNIINYGSSVGFMENKEEYVWLFCSLVIIYFVVRFLYKKITLIEYFFNSKDGFNDRYLIDHFEKTSSNLLILTLPGSGIEDLCLNKHILANKHFELNKDLLDEQADLKELFAEHDYELYTNKNKEPIFNYLLILKYIEFRADKSENLAERILSFEKYFKSSKYKVIWLSNSDPSVQVEKLIKNSNKFYSKVIKDGNYKDIEDYYSKSHTFDKMLKIFDEFDKTYFSLTEYSDNNDLSTFEENIKKRYEYLYSVIDIELKYSLYLNKLRKSFFQSGNSSYAFSFFDLEKDEATLFRHTPNLNEEVILKIQDTAYTYYLSLWNCLSNQEKFVLYDMAVDNLTNYHNLSILLSLKEKGLLVYAEEYVIHPHEEYAGNKTLQIINKSFRNFILTRINPSEAKLLEEELKGTTTWQTLRIIVGAVIVLISIFIYITQETVLQKYISLFTGMAAFLPLVLKAFTGFKDTSSGSEK